MNERLNYEIGDVIRLKKPHPRDSNQQEVLRVGADFRLKYMECGHQIMIARRLVEKSTGGLTKAEEDSQAAAPEDTMKSVMRIVRRQKSILHLPKEFIKIVIRDVLCPCSCY